MFLEKVFVAFFARFYVLVVVVLFEWFGTHFHRGVVIGAEKLHHHLALFRAESGATRVNHLAGQNRCPDIENKIFRKFCNRKNLDIKIFENFKKKLFWKFWKNIFEEVKTS